MNEARIGRLLQAAQREGLLVAEPRCWVLFDMDDLDRRTTALRRAFPATALHAVAMKACPVRRLLKHLAGPGFGLEVASEVELALALQIVAPGQIVFDSPCKTARELGLALQAGVRVNVDNKQELARIAQQPPPGGVGLRINPGIGQSAIPQTHTAALGSKFGIDVHAERAWVLDVAKRHPWVDGLHVHMGSQGCSQADLVMGVRSLLGLATEIERNGRRLKVLDIGGGLPVDYSRDGTDSFTEYASALRAEVPELFDGNWQIVTEFGRHLLAPSGVVASRVEYTKTSGSRRIAINHVGADLFLRTAYRPDTWSHRITVHAPDGRLKTEMPAPWDIAGPLCFSGDLLAEGRDLPDMEQGDIVVVHDAGAYTLSMWSRYNSRRSPGVYGWADQEGLSCLREPESVEDVLRFWG